MRYKYISYYAGQKSTCSSEKDSPNNVIWIRCIYPKREVVLVAPDIVNLPCHMHDTRLCQFDVKITNN